MPVTIKQIEAFHAVATLGSVVAAADHLSLVQSTVSKRLVELEAVIGAPLFERGPRTVLLTRRGQSVLSLAAEMLRLEAQFREEAGGPIIFRGRFRFGVTELVALSWLPRLIVAMKESISRRRPCTGGRGERRFVREARRPTPRSRDWPRSAAPAGVSTASAGFRSVAMDVRAGLWTGGGRGSARANGRISHPNPGCRFGATTPRSLTGSVQRACRSTASSSVTAPMCLPNWPAAGLGITFLTEDFFRRDVESGRLRLIRTIPRIPPIQYFAVIRADVADPLAQRVAQIARRICDFSARRLAP